MSQNTFAASYNQATVNFYSDSQHTATVNLPWSVNPGFNSFYLNNLFFNENSYNNQKLAYINGRVVAEVNPKTNDHFYVCGRDASVAWGNNSSSFCLGKISVVYSDSSRTEISDIPVYFNESTSPYTYNLYFDFNTNLESSKQIGFVQFQFYAASGYDVISRNQSWNNTTLMVLVEGRSSISVYETPPSGVDIANDLLQQQVGQNNTIINQNQTIIDQNHAYNSREYEAESNINNQSASDIEGTENQKTTDLIGAIGSLIGALTSIQPDNCVISLPFPNYAGGDTSVDLCQNKEKAPEIVLIGSSVFLVLFALKYWNAMAVKIYKVIRSFIDGSDDTEGEE